MELEDPVLPTLVDDIPQVRSCRAQPRRTLHPTPSGESDDAFLESICRAERKLHPTPSDESDDDWLVSICRSGKAAQAAGNSTSTSSELVGPWSSLDFLVRDLQAMECPHLPILSAPLQDTILFDSKNYFYGWPPGKKCVWRFAAWGKSLGVFAFKIGIAYSPLDRWGRYELEEMWMFMDVMHEGNPEECRCLEKELIGKLKPISGCYNVLPGGEGIRAGVTVGKCFCYVVYAVAGDGVGMHQAWLARKRDRPR